MYYKIPMVLAGTKFDSKRQISWIMEQGEITQKSSALEEETQNWVIYSRSASNRNIHATMDRKVACIRKKAQVTYGKQTSRIWDSSHDGKGERLGSTTLPADSKT